MATWPATLPNIKLAGYSLTPVDPSIRTDMESGAARSRRRTKARNDKTTPEWVMTDAQFAIFRTWFDDDAGAAGGSAWFAINAAIGTGGVVSVQARFIGAFKSSALGALRWRVSAELEIR